MKFIQAIGLLIIVGLLPVRAWAQMDNTDARFIPKDSFFVMQFDMQKLLGYERMGSENLETIVKGLREETKIDLLSMKTLTVQFCPGEDPTELDDDMVGVIMTFSNPIDQEAFLEGLGDEMAETEFDGKKYLRNSSVYGPSIYFPDDKTIVMGMAVTMEKMISKDGEDARLRGLLKATDPDAEIKAAFRTNELYKKFLMEINQEIPITPFNLEKAFGQAETAVISGNLKSSTPLRIEATCQDEEAAEDLAKKTKLLVDLGRGSIPIGREATLAMKKELEGRELEGFEKMALVQMEWSLGALDQAERILEATKTSHQGKQVLLEVKLMGGVKELVPLFSKMFAAQFTMMEEMQREFEKEVEDFEIEID